MHILFPDYFIGWGIFILKINLVVSGYCPYLSRMKPNHTRKDVDLHKEVIKALQQLADKKGWKLKPFMEKVLIKESQKIKK